VTWSDPSSPLAKTAPRQPETVGLLGSCLQLTRLKGCTYFVGIINL